MFENENEKENVLNQDANEPAPETEQPTAETSETLENAAANGETPSYSEWFKQVNSETETTQETAPKTKEQTAPVPEKIEYTPVEEIKDYRPLSRGLKTFCAVIAVILALTIACTAGYYFGRKSVYPSHSENNNLNLAARPKDGDEMTPAEVYKKLNKSIVGIRVYNANGDSCDASGVIYSKDGYIITNDHIFGEVGAPKIRIYTYDGKEYTAKFVAGDIISDIAMIKADEGNFTPAVFGDSKETFCGENVVAIGRPSEAANDTSITSGIISMTSRRAQITSSYSSKFIQTDSAINPGSSGGALSDMYGHVIGITSSKIAGVEYESIGFAIPSVTVKRIVGELLKNGRVENRAKLGITYNEIESSDKDINNYSSVGLLIASISEDSGLYGKANVGDIITHINGIKITRDDIVLDIIEEAKAGDSIKLTVLGADGKSAEYTVKLSANIGESNYSEKLPEKNEQQQNGDQNSDSSGGGAFNFPFGD